jgi:hypothetical protein
VKSLLISETIDAFEKNDEMSLLCSVKDLSQKEAEWKLNDKTWTIEEILYHVASCKITYCKQGFNIGLNEQKPFGNINKMIQYNRIVHECLIKCLEQITDDSLEKPIPTRCHGESASHFFFIMLMHDISHGAQIRTIRRAYGSRIDYYPIKH